VTDKTTYEGTFMQEQKPKVTAAVTDNAGNAISGIRVVGGKWNVTHTDGTQLEKGGYTGSYGSGSYEVDIGMDGTAQISDLRTAGVYTSSMTVLLAADNTINDKYIGYDVTNSPGFTVTSKVPYVKFTATDPKAGETFQGANEAGDNTQDRVNSISTDGYSVTVYYQASSSQDGCGNWGCNGYTPSKATLTLYDVGDAFTQATCTIISKGKGGNVTYTFSPTELSNTQNLGAASGTTRNGIGSKAQATELILTMGTGEGSQYKFTLVNPISATAEY